MKSTAIALLLLSAVFAAPSVRAQHPLEYLHGTWEGSGNTSGMPSSVRFTWGPVLGGRYTALQIHNRMTGVWVDSRGDILSLRATLNDRTLIAHWGSEGTEQGRSEYRLLPDGTLEAVDSVRNDSGEWREFGRALLSRVK